MDEAEIEEIIEPAAEAEIEEAEVTEPAVEAETEAAEKAQAEANGCHPGSETGRGDTADHRF